MQKRCFYFKKVVESYLRFKKGLVVLRLFVAIELEDAVKNAIETAANGLALFGSGSFSPKDAYHITLAFLGERADANTVKVLMDGVEFSPFTVSTANLGNFGSTYFVSVEESIPLKNLQAQLAGALKADGVWFDEKPFKPHITLARRFEKRGEPFVFVPEAAFEVKEIALMATVGAGVYKTLYKKAGKTQKNV